MIIITIIRTKPKVRASEVGSECSSELQCLSDGSRIGSGSRSREETVNRGTEGEHVEARGLGKRKE